MPILMSDGTQDQTFVLDDGRNEDLPFFVLPSKYFAQWSNLFSHSIRLQISPVDLMTEIWKLL
jgi:hypothetical protein